MVVLELDGIPLFSGVILALHFLFPVFHSLALGPRGVYTALFPWKTTPREANITHVLAPGFSWSGPLFHGPREAPHHVSLK